MINLISDKTYSVSDVDEILKTALTRGTCQNNKRIKYLNIICAFDIETTSFTDDIEADDSYKDLFLYNYLKDSTIKCSDIEYLPNVKGVHLSHNKGYPIDELYADLNSIYPYMFDESVIDPDTKLKMILKAFEDNTPTNSDIHKHAIMYIWQFAINGRVIIGRTWSEFLELMEKLQTAAESEDAKIIIWVHSLAYEFQFIRRFFNWSKVFSISPRKPIYAITGNLEFRCSYILTNYNLANLAKQLQYYDIKKLVGDLDYDLYRSPETPISAEELHYCINDVLIVSAYIQECIFKEQKICNIPLTATGYCRRYCRKMCFGTRRSKQYNKYNALMQSLKLSGKDEYMQLKRAFAGGFTHASAIWSGRTVTADQHGMISSIDFTSSYPFALLSECRYPMSSGKVIKLTSREEFEHYMKYYCCIFDVEFIGLEPKIINENYISSSHCFNTEKIQTNNGRVVRADKLTTTITELDYKIICKTYKWSKMRIYNFRIYKRGYLPKELILSIIKLYRDKTTLKGVIGKETEYLNGKALLNSVY